MENKSSHKSKFYNKRAFKVSISLVLIFSIFISSFIFSASAYDADFPDKVVIKRNVFGENSNGAKYSVSSSSLLNKTLSTAPMYSSSDLGVNYGIIKDTFGYTVTDKITIKNDSGLILISNPKSKIKISLMNVFSGFWAYLPSGMRACYVNTVSSVLVNYSDGSHKYFNSTNYIARETNGFWNNYYLTIIPDYHILSIEITVKCILGNVYPSATSPVAFYFTNYDRAVLFYYDYVNDEVFDDDLGFFESIVKWVKSLFNSVVNGFNNILNFIGGVWNFVFVNLGEIIFDSGGFFISLVRSIIDFGNIGGSA